MGDHSLNEQETEKRDRGWHVLYVLASNTIYIKMKGY